MTQTFNKFMVDVGVGTNRKVRRLPVAQRWAFVAGVLALAAQSPVRGALLIADGVPVTDEDVAEQATVTVRDARAAMASLRAEAVLVADDGGVWWVQDFQAWTGLRLPRPDARPAIPRAVRVAVMRRDGFACLYCGRHTDAIERATYDGSVAPVTTDGHRLEVDHVLAWSRGGRHDIDNLQILCGPCNRTKAAR